LRRQLARALLICALASPFYPQRAVAAEYYGQVTFGGIPVPGVSVTATKGKATLTVTTDERGLYRFEDLGEGKWSLDISLQCFLPVHSEVTIDKDASPGKFELTLLPPDELKAMAKTAQPYVVAEPKLQAATENKPAAPAAAPVEIPKAPSDANDQSSDGLLVNGSVNNAATSQYSLDRAFGNRRLNSRSLYNGGFAVQLDNSALDARQYSLSGFESPKPAYDRVTAGFTVGGPLRIPHVLPRGPNFFVAYQFMRSNTAASDSALVPTEAEREGNLANAVGQPATILDPATGQPFPGSVVPVSPQANALLALYPLPNVAGNPLYNYQVPVLNTTHQDVVQLRMDKTLGRKDQLYGNFNLQSNRADSVSLFDFVDITDTLGLNTNINWSHRFNQRLFLFAGYRFSRLRTLLRPEFEKRENISGAAGINGNDQDPAQWGPPALNFSSGTAALSDGESTFNRNRTDSFSLSAGIYHGRHNVTIGGDLRKQQYNDNFEQDPRGAFTFTGAVTGSDLADFLLGVPDASSIAFGNADKYLRQTASDAYVNDDWRALTNLTINAGVRWEYGEPMTELFDRLVNLDVAQGFVSVAPVLASDPVGPLTGQHYPNSLVRPDRLGIEPRIGVSWRPIPASTVVVRTGYGIYHDTSVYLTPTLQLAQQAPLSTSVNEQNSATCPLTLANGFPSCGQTTPQAFAMDPNFRVGYAQTWQLAVQRDLPYAMQGTVTYLGVKGTHGVQQILPNSFPLEEANPCPSCPSGFVYETSGGNSTRQSAQLQLRRRLRAGFMAALTYTYSKSIDDDAALGGQGHIGNVTQSAGSLQSQTSSLAASATPAPAIAQDWLDPRAERSLSSFDQRHLLNVQAQYTTGQGIEGGTLMQGWRGRLFKEWTLLTQITTGSGLPETPVYPFTVPGTGVVGPLRPALTGAPIYASSGSAHLNATAYSAPAPGLFGTAGRNSITGPAQFSLDSGLQRTFRPTSRFFLDARIDATNLMNHVVFTTWNTTVGNTQFGLPISTNAMRSLQATFRLRF
jgi:carboxypeptidase family protein